MGNKILARSLAVFALAAAGLAVGNLAYADTPRSEPAAGDMSEVSGFSKLPKDEYSLGEVLLVEDSPMREVAGAEFQTHTYRVKLLSGSDKGVEVNILDNDLDVSASVRSIAEGDRVVVVKVHQFEGDPAYYVADNYRLPALGWITLIFFGIAVAFGGRRGFTSILGLVSTVGVIIYFVVPRVVMGDDPLIVCLLAALVIAVLALYLAHGFNRRTSLALVSTLATLGISALVAVKFVFWAHLFGMGSEDALFLQGSGFDNIDLRGLLLGGIILGTLGILDDITTAQAAVVDELKHANEAFKFKELYARGISVGKEHIASLINTLFLAYAGASLPLFLLFSVNQGQPLWFIVNSEIIAEEVVRTLVGSLCLILAVPITTALAALYFGQAKVKATGQPTEMHHYH